METYRFSFGEVPPLGRKTTLCLGTFDGVHRGHQSLLLEARKITEGDVAVLCFDQSPTTVLQNGKSAEILTSLEDKKRLFSSLGVDILYLIRLDASFLAHSAVDFMEKVLAPLCCARFVVGEDYTFGREAEGNVILLRRRFPVDVVPLLEADGEKVSTQRIVRFLKEGQVKEAASLLGRPYQIYGRIVSGFKNGRKFGFPTANLALDDNYVLPRFGVYLGISYLRGIPYKSLINVGNNPTLGLLKKPLVECYLEGLKDEVYGESLYVEFLSFVREEIHFKDASSLQEQMEKDKRLLSSSSRGE